MRGYRMVIRTFRQPGANKPIDAQRLTSSSAPLSSRDGESDYMQRYPSDYLYKTISVNLDPRSQVAGGDTQVVIRTK